MFWLDEAHPGKRPALSTPLSITPFNRSLVSQIWCHKSSSLRTIIPCHRQFPDLPHPQCCPCILKITLVKVDNFVKSMDVLALVKATKKHGLRSVYKNCTKGLQLAMHTGANAKAAWASPFCLPIAARGSNGMSIDTKSSV